MNSLNLGLRVIKLQFLALGADMGKPGKTSVYPNEWGKYLFTPDMYGVPYQGIKRRGKAVATGSKT